MTSDLPELPRVLVLSGTTIERVIHTSLIFHTRRGKRWCVSQRHLLGLFNRSNQRTMSRYLRAAVKKGFVKKHKKSRGARPDTYVRGEFFTHRAKQGELLIRLSNALYAAPRGILWDWPYPTAWGHGCVSAVDILCLATLRRLGEPMKREAICRYLQSLVTPPSLNSTLRRLCKKGLLNIAGSAISLTPTWEDTMRHCLEENPACNQRKHKGDERRRQESAQNRRRVVKGTITEAERCELKTLPCVRQGCHRKAVQMEHFPPKRYLKDLDDYNNISLIWAICPKHNVETSEFIKTLGPTNINSIPPFRIVGDTEPFLLYRLVSNHWYGKFYEAFLAGDREAAIQAIRITLSYWLAIKDLPRPNHRDMPLSLRMKHIAELGRRYSTWKSQLS